MSAICPTITRRDLLRISGAALAGAITGWPICRAADAPARPMIGFSLYNMKMLPIAEALQVCQETGYECVELAVLPDWPCDPAKLTEAQVLDLKQQLATRGLKLASLMENLPVAVDGEAHQSNLNRLKRAMELSRRLVHDQTPLIETVLGGSPDKWPLLKDKFLERLRDWAAVAVEHSAVIAIKAHIGGALHMPQDAADIVKTIDSKGLQLTFDFSHFQLRDLALADAWQAMAERTRFIHVKDGRGKPGEFQFLLPGEGTIDFVELFRLLKASRYTGPVVAEVSAQISFKPGYDPIAAAKKCWPVLREAREKAWATSAGTR